MKINIFARRALQILTILTTLLLLLSSFAFAGQFKITRVYDGDTVKALITGLESAILVMDKWDDLTPQRRQSMIESLQQLISQSNKAYGTETAKH